MLPVGTAQNQASNSTATLPSILLGIRNDLRSARAELEPTAQSGNLAGRLLARINGVENGFKQIEALLPFGSFDTRPLTPHSLKSVKELNRNDRRFLAELLQAYVWEGLNGLSNKEMLRRLDAALRTVGLTASSLVKKGFISREPDPNSIETIYQIRPERLPQLIDACMAPLKASSSGSSLRDLNAPDVFEVLRRHQFNLHEKLRT